jgi:hypothetical protein
MVEPTRRMLDQFDAYGGKLTIMADVAEILRFKEHAETTGRDGFHYHAIADQLRDAVRREHDVQLHLHSSYFNARCQGGRWSQDWSEYNLASLPLERLFWMVKCGKDFLESLLQPVDPDYRCIAFRAANWAASPSRNLVQALVANGFAIETSVFKNGRREGLVSFDYSGAPSELVPWKVREADICHADGNGALTEFPIYCEQRWLGAFLTRHRVHRVLLSRRHRVSPDDAPNGKGSSVSAGPRQGVLFKAARLVRRHAWKADFNQCTGRQLVRALERAHARYSPVAGDLPFVLIGHSKLFSRANERSLRPLLAHIARHSSRFQPATFAAFELDRLPSDPAPASFPSLSWHRPS